MLNNLYIIVAMTENGVIGDGNDLIYYIPEDLKYFKEKTLHNTIVVGRTTYFTFPKRPLPNRKTIVLSRTNNIENVEVMRSVDEVLTYAKEHPNEEIFISGGGVIYTEFLKYVSKLYITEIEEKNESKGKTYFPKIDYSEWKLVQEENGKNIPNSIKNFTFKVYERIQKK